MIESNKVIRQTFDKSDYVYLKDEPNDKGELGITHNRIVEIPNFISPEAVTDMIAYFENCIINDTTDWGDIAFYGSKGKGLLPEADQMAKFNLPPLFWQDIKDKFQEGIESVFDRKVKANTSHAQKWEVGGFASPHSDNSDLEGVPNSFSINKYVGILYLNDEYEGGYLGFPEHKIRFKPNLYSYYVFPGGIENVHEVEEITKGTRYTMVSFWDYAEAEYDQETLDRWAEEEKQVRIAQAKQKEEWAKGNKHA